MRPFGHPRDRVWLELMDGRLVPEARLAAEAHLDRCERCAARASAIRLARQACAGMSWAAASRTAPLDDEPARWRAVLAMAAAIVVIAVALWQLDGPRLRFEEGGAGQLPSTLERAARAQHDRASRNAVTLDLASAAPEEIRAFLKQQRAPFANLAVTRPQADRDAFVPVGAALTHAGGVPASAVFYRINGAPLTLLTARVEDLDDPPERALVGLRIIHRQADGLHTYAWTQAGQSYALATTASARQACRLCHADAEFAERLARATDRR